MQLIAISLASPGRSGTIVGQRQIMEDGPMHPNRMMRLRTDLEQMLGTLGSEYGLTFELGGISHGETTLSVKLTAEMSGLALGETKAAREFTRWAWRHGLKQTDFGRTFWDGKQEMQIVGWNSGAPKYPVMLVEVGTGKKYRAPAKHVLSLLPAEVAA